MKNCYFWATPSGPINLIKGDEMPPEPEKGICSEEPRPDCYNQEGCICANKWRPYHAALNAAKAASIPIQNRVVAVELINRRVRELGSDAKVWDSLYGKEGAIYGPFSLRYEIQERHSVRCAAHTSEALMKRGHVPGECTCKCEVVAILYDDTPEKEPQEDQNGWISVKEAWPIETVDALWCRVPVEEPYVVASICDVGFDEKAYTHWRYLPDPPSSL